MEFAPFFEKATRQRPFPYQERLADGATLPDLLEAPTGSGKTAAAVLGWLWRRRYGSPAVRAVTPRRLVYCLPMRTLVDQTAAATSTWLERLGLEDEIGVHVLRGGAVDRSWESRPERQAILVGTQDQLLSRALNRGYGMSRYRWPVHFALLNNDAFWVLDETQLMGSGLSTSAQMAAFRRGFSTWGAAGSLWMSATLEAERLATVDLRTTPLERLALGEADRKDPRLAIRLEAVKRLQRARALCNGKTEAYAEELAPEVLARHREGTLTLVVVNRVARAQEIFRALRRLSPDRPLTLLHSRFRPAERAPAQDGALTPGWAGIVVATQAVEAGVDISAATLFTELAPWSSMVQRFGRCNRRGEHRDGADIFWIDVPSEKDASPYEVSELEDARACLHDLPDAGILRLPKRHRTALRPAGPVLRRRDLLDLFDTQPDLNGCDIDISRYVRDADDADVEVYWRDWPADGVPPDAQPGREELCRVPVQQVRDFLKKRRVRAQRWNALQRSWEPVPPPQVLAGMLLLFPADAGGYDADLGWRPSSSQRVLPVPVDTGSHDADENDALSTGAGRFILLEQHTRAVVRELEAILSSLEYALPSEDLRLAAWWHDVGKVHPVFQDLLLQDVAEDDPLRKGGPWAKSATGRGGRARRPHFRHELASALALLASGGGNLAAYIVAAHHGKVRLGIRSRPTEPRLVAGARVALGIHDGDVIGPVRLDHLSVPGVKLDLAITELGAGSWLERTLALLEDWGPFRLALLEALLRTADWRASAAEMDGNHGTNHD